MLHKTKGIVLKLTNYSETSVVAKILTQKFGLQTFLINGVKKPKAKIRLNMLQPLHILEMIIYHKENAAMHRINDARNEPVLKSIPYHIIKSSITIFLNEMILKSIKEQHEDVFIYDFIEKSIEWLDETEDNIANFHLLFLLKFSKYLGFYPDLSGIDQSLYFDLYNSKFTQHHPPHKYIVDEENILSWKTLLKCDSYSEPLIMSHQNRRQILNLIITYYQLHIDSFGEVKSHKVLEEILG